MKTQHNTGLKSRLNPKRITRLKRDSSQGLPMYRVSYDDGIAIVREDFLSEQELALLKINQEKN